MVLAMRGFPFLLVLATLCLGLAACGGAAGAQDIERGFSQDTAAQQIAVRVDPGGRLAWERAEYAATAGDVTFVVGNPTGLAHDFAVEGPGVSARSKPFPGGSTQRFTLTDLPSGTYRIVCMLPGHREAGMVATLHVR